MTTYELAINDKTSALFNDIFQLFLHETWPKLVPPREYQNKNIIHNSENTFRLR